MSEQSGAPIEAYITNLGKYVEGELVGKWHPFPTTTDELQATLKEIGVDGVRYEEFFCTDYDSSISGLTEHLPEYANLDELNYLAAKIEELEGYEVDIYEAVIEAGEYCGSVSDLINLTENIGAFDFLPGVENDEDFGYYYVEDAGIYDTKSMGSLANYIDYERFGRDVRLDEGGTFTNMGYLRGNDGFDYEYGGIDDIPDEYRVFAFPERERRERPSVIDKLAAAKETVSKAPAADKPDTPKKSHDAEL